ncbi:hypothetical protein EJF18_40097 [Clavispora lusitaniae]|uniref:Uncharacterized protein n=2 Tax=Clavispora lusitaniae TaxID=36911 RepID=C4Y562_CLAL4|nr:uncharacterized protein CLUG_03296 [Clavispora lusitaniae ATCC 42720]QFZ28073.1 hypothetical protein EJF14_40097 [Clavispora lusitaniae]EEQ39169.1 hypothetical protein CLUG_03296 [Clavispora lusitaniae ATCC 42720]QFZ33736.1 hypothetical protein EJF16_40097 [Clavispora lusitaniae]QFZ39420.1 hypothetical protein EJF15_40097 [Clavispora lusitaniae]QFZ45102.1 hypothetical protein EJF18_40097 [Clavispora lusitaniae]
MRWAPFNFFARSVFLPISDWRMFSLMLSIGGKLSPYLSSYLVSASSSKATKSNGSTLGLSLGPFEWICLERSSSWAACATAFRALLAARDVVPVLASDSDADSRWWARGGIVWIFICFGWNKGVAREVRVFLGPVGPGVAFRILDKADSPDLCLCQRRPKLPWSTSSRPNVAKIPPGCCRMHCQADAHNTSIRRFVILPCRHN